MKYEGIFRVLHISMIFVYLVFRIHVFLRNFARVYVLFMPNLILIGIFVLVVAILFIATTHMYYTKKRDRFIEEIRNIIPYYIGIHGGGANGLSGGKYNLFRESPNRKKKEIHGCIYIDDSPHIFRSKEELFKLLNQY